SRRKHHVDTANESLQAIRRSKACCDRTKLVTFLGTQHRGSKMADWGEIAPKNPDTLININNLVSVLQRQGLYDEAGHYTGGDWEGRRTCWNRSTHTRINDLATILRRQGKHDEAELLYRQAMDGLKSHDSCNRSFCTVS